MVVVGQVTHLRYVNPECRYIIMDEGLYLLNNTNGAKERGTCTVLENCTEALEQCGFDSEQFANRGGRWYDRDPCAATSASSELF